MRPAPMNAFGDHSPLAFSDDELVFLSAASASANKDGLGIVFGGQSYSEMSCLFLVVPFPGQEARQDADALPDWCLIHGVEYTGDLITDVTCLLNSFSEMGRSDSDFGHFNTITRWDASEIGLA
jgi:hypothetical protein